MFPNEALKKRAKKTIKVRKYESFYTQKKKSEKRKVIGYCWPPKKKIKLFRQRRPNENVEQQ